MVQDIREADAVIFGAPGRQGGMCGEMRLFLDSLALLQVERKGGGFGALKVMSTHMPSVENVHACLYDSRSRGWVEAEAVHNGMQKVHLSCACPEHRGGTL